MGRDSPYWKIGVTVGLCFGPVTAFAQNSRSQAIPVGKTAHRLSIDDVLDVQHLDHATLSPDGEWIAVVVQRPAHDGEIFGRNAYEIDPSRNDVWLISRHTGTWLRHLLRRLLRITQSASNGDFGSKADPLAVRLRLLYA